MKMILSFLAVFFSFAAVATNLSAEVSPQNFEIGADVYHFSYKEPIFDLEEKGLMYGVFGVYTLRPEEGEALNLDVIDVYKVEGRFNYGKVDYESAPSGTIDDITDYTLEIRGLVGKNFPLNEQFLLTPYIGLAYRYLNDDTGGKLSSTGAAGYERESRYFYLPVGAELTSKLSSEWQLALKGEYDVFLQGKQTSHLSDANSGFPDIENEQRKGFGYRASVKLSRITEEYNLFVEPFIRYWHIEDSEATTASGSVFIVTGLEPENTTTEIGARLGMEF